MRDLIQGGGLVMLSHYSLIKVLRVEAYMQGTIRLIQVGEQQYPLGWLGNWCSDSLSNHVIEHPFDLFPVFYGYLALGMLHWDNRRVSPDGVGTRHIANGVKGVGESSLQCHDVPDLGCGTRVHHLRWLHLGQGARVVYKDGFTVIDTALDGGFCIVSPWCR